MPAPGAMPGASICIMATWASMSCCSMSFIDAISCSMGTGGIAPPIIAGSIGGAPGGIAPPTIAGSIGGSPGGMPPPMDGSIGGAPGGIPPPIIAGSMGAPGGTPPPIIAGSMGGAGGGGGFPPGAATTAFLDVEPEKRSRKGSTAMISLFYCIVRNKPFIWFRLYLDCSFPHLRFPAPVPECRTLGMGAGVTDFSLKDR